MAQLSSQESYRPPRPDFTTPTAVQRILASVMTEVPITAGLYLTSPREWPAFSQAFLAKARELQLEDYLFRGKEIPGEPVAPVIPDSIIEEGPLLVDPSIDHIEEYDRRLRLAEGRSIDELEEFNRKLGKHNDAFREFMDVRDKLEKLRLWIILHISPLIKERCLEGIQKAFVGRRPGELHPRDWYAYLANYMAVWVRYDAARRKYLDFWCGFLEEVASKEEGGDGRAQVKWLWLLDRMKALIQIVREARQCEVPEVMDENQWFFRHLAGFGVVDLVLYHSTDEGDKSLAEVEGIIERIGEEINPEDILRRFNQVLELKYVELGEQEFVTIMSTGIGGDGADQSSGHAPAWEEYQRMKARLSRLEEAGAGAGATFQAEAEPHVPNFKALGSSPHSPEEKSPGDCSQGEVQPQKASPKHPDEETTPKPEAKLDTVPEESSHEGESSIAREDTDSSTEKPKDESKAKSTEEHSPLPSPPARTRKRDMFQRLARAASERARSLFSNT